MQVDTDDRPFSADGSQHQHTYGGEHGQTPAVQRAASEGPANGKVKAANSKTDDTIPNTTPTIIAATTSTITTDVNVIPAPNTAAGEGSGQPSLSGVSIEIPLVVDDALIDREFGSDESMPPPEPDPDMPENILEVDDDYVEPAESIYAASHYPAVPVRYRVERFDSATINSSSRSLYVEDLDYVFENGRRYCGDYIFPNDELEQDRLRVMHQVFLQVFNFELTSVPLENPRYILDIGTGTGEWAIGMGEMFSSCEVVGVDISAIQPTAVPHNVFFEVDDCEIEWMRPDDTIDLVHLRDMAGAISDWDFIFREAYACLKPGGYLEVLDFHDHTSDISTFFDCFPPESQIHEFARAVDEASIKAGRRRGTHHMDPAKLESLGYVDVHISERSIPLNPINDSVAKLWLIACLHMVEAGCLRLLTKYLDWEPTRALAACDQISQEIKDKALDPSTTENLKVSMRVLTARKPRPGEVPPTSNDHPMDSSGLLVAENGHLSGDDRSADESTIGA